MNVLVTGGAGFIGSSLARALLVQGHRVRVLDNLTAGSAENVPDGAEFLQGDIRDLDQVEEACAGIQTVFHQAAFKSVPKSIDDPLTAETCNAQGTLNVLTASHGAGVRRLVYASSSSAYGEANGIKNETMPANPVSPYGVSKLGGEHYCRIWSRIKGLSTVSLRYFNVFGPGQKADSTYSAVFPAFISSLMKEESPKIFGDGEQTRDFTFIDDVVKANIQAMEAGDQVSGEVINICAGSPRTVNDVFRTVAAYLQSDVKPAYLPERPGDIRHSHGEIGKAKRLLQWQPTADWTESVNATVDWFRTA